MTTRIKRSQTNVTWLTLLASVLVLFAGRLAPLQLPQFLEHTFLSVQTQVQNETPAKIESSQQLRIAVEIPNQSQHPLSAIVPPIAFIPVSHPFAYEIATHPTQGSRLLRLQPRSRSPPLQIA